MTFEESIRFLYSLGNELKTAKFGLENITALLERLGNPERKARFVHVAGTNGKGSTCAMIEAGLRTAGHRTGLYTSPHLSSPTERIQVAGKPISEERFGQAFDIVHAEAKRMPLHPTYFETITAMAFVVFAQDAEIVVLETGLGGRLDATNVVIPELSVITPIDFDHETFLGYTLPEIAAEKAGIFKPDIPGLTANQHPEVMEVLERHRPLRKGTEWPFRNLRVERWGSHFEAGPYSLNCPLAGAHQAENARTAAMALDTLGVDASGIQVAQWPGRLERIAPGVILDGAHNPAGVRALVAYIEEFFAGERLQLIFGAMRDKDVAQMVHRLFPLFEEVILTVPNQPRSLRAAEIAAMAPHPNVRLTENVAEARALAHGTTFVSGSLFLVAEARELWLNASPDHTGSVPAERP